MANDITAIRPIDVAAWHDACHAPLRWLDGDGSGRLWTDSIKAVLSRSDSAQAEG